MADVEQPSQKWSDSDSDAPSQRRMSWTAARVASATLAPTRIHQLLLVDGGDIDRALGTADKPLTRSERFHNPHGSEERLCR